MEIIGTFGNSLDYNSLLLTRFVDGNTMYVSTMPLILRFSKDIFQFIERNLENNVED